MQLFNMLHNKKLTPLESPTLSPLDEELKRYSIYLEEVCGFSKDTRISRLQYARKFLQYIFGQNPIRVDKLKPEDIFSFIKKNGENYKAGTVRVVCCSIRSYLRYRSFLGDVTNELIVVVPSAVQQRLSTIPKTLTNEEIDGLLQAFDRTSPIGMRNYAMICCLADLGLRINEVSSIQIDNLNWREGSLKIKSKGGRIDILPLPPHTGDAIVHYLRYGRPKTQSRMLFVRHRAPLDMPISQRTVENTVRLAFSRSNLSFITGGHILRRSLACRMLTSGASLKDIADVLRHRCLDTTTIYTKVDLPRLACLATPWPGRIS